MADPAQPIPLIRAPCACLADSTVLASLATASVSLTSLAAWHGVGGVLAVMDDDMTGWDMLKESYLARGAAIAAALLLTTRHGQPIAFAVNTALVSLMGVALDDSRAQRFGWSLEGAMARRLLVETGSALPSFALALLTTTERRNPSSVDGEGVNVYRQLLDAWNHENALVDAIDNALEHHLVRTSDPNDAGYGLST